MFKKISLIGLLLIISFTMPIIANNVDQYGNLEIDNEYISIIVNQNELNRGRFAINVTGGDPGRDSDNEKPLIYGHPHPWTSYTTIKIDGEKYVFGGQTDRRSGRSGKYGDLISGPKIEGDEILTTYNYRNIEVTQSLSLTKSTTTGLKDTAQIEYQIENKSDSPSDIGLRFMVNTLLGENDGAPYRVYDEEIETDRKYEGDQMPQFWQAFDSLSDPKVTAQGTLQGPNLTTPDRLYLSNWGSLADGLWDFNFDPGREFLREGEFELDSAMALFWEPETLEPGETRRYATNYGLGGITLVPGILSLGVTSPAELVMDWPDNSAQIIAYIQNTADITAENVVVELDAADELNLLSGEQKIELGDLESGQTSQLMWEVSPKQIRQQNLNYEIRVKADNTDDNQVSRSLNIVGAPDLSLRLVGPYRLRSDNNQLEKDSFVVHSVITNSGASTAYQVDTELFLAPGLRVKRGELENKYLGNLPPGQSIRVPWEIEVMDLARGDLPYSVTASSANTRTQSQVNAIAIPSFEPEIYFKPVHDLSQLEAGDYFSVDVIAKNITDFYHAEFDIKYNEDILRPTHISRGDIFINHGELLSWNRPRIDFTQAEIKDISGVLDNKINLREGTVARLNFKLLAEGKAELRFSNRGIYNDKGDNIFVEFKDYEFDIGGN